MHGIILHLHACIHGGSNIKRAAAAPAVLASVSGFMCERGEAETDLGACDGCEAVQRGRRRGQDKGSSVFGDEGACVRIGVSGEDCSLYERARVKEGTAQCACQSSEKTSSILTLDGGQLWNDAW